MVAVEADQIGIKNGALIWIGARRSFPLAHQITSASPAGPLQQQDVNGPDIQYPLSLSEFVADMVVARLGLFD